MTLELHLLQRDPLVRCPFLVSAVKKRPRRAGRLEKRGLPVKFVFKKVNFLFQFFRIHIHYFLTILAQPSSSPNILLADIAELDGGKVANIDFPNPNDLTAFDVSISPDTGYWTGATYHFTFTIPPHYPHSPPKVECNTKIYHPNIDLQGKVCLNILREDWKPVLDINAVIYGLIYLFYEPNPDDPLNHEAAELFRKDVRQFERLVTRTLRGGILDGVQFERLV
jgi:ubiquitin-protein ligase